MAAPGNSVSGTFPAGPLKGPMSVQPAQRENLQRVLPAVGPTQGFFMRESKALGAIQIMNGLFHLALGGLLMIPTGVHAPICLAVWYPLWGGVMIRVKVILNSLTLFAAITGIILLIMDILNIKLSHFLKMERLILIKTPVPYINIYNCEPAVPSEKNSPSTQYCYNIQSVFLGILSVMLTFAFFQKLVAAGIVEHEWKTLCSRSKANVVLLSAEEKKEQTIEIKEEMVELTEVSSQSKNEEEIEIIPVQEEEETEANFPEPPQDQISSPAENDSSP